MSQTPQNLDELYAKVQKHKGEAGFQALEEFLWAKIDDYRDKLERVEDPIENTKTRGRLKECRETIKLLTE